MASDAPRFDSRMYCTCDQCGERFLVAYLPQSIDTIAKMFKRLTCPRCGNTKFKMGPNAGRLDTVPMTAEEMAAG